MYLQKISTQVSLCSLLVDNFLLEQAPVCPMIIRLTNDKNLDKSILKALAHDNFKVIYMARFDLDSIEDIVGKEENAGYQHF